ncbi:probable DNA excision repair protein ERCC-6 [Coccomyxa sp. Obi]|nr:probable DNA excision repair protein ERCC-6 [Coccomyxa sp. Obi]
MTEESVDDLLQTLGGVTAVDTSEVENNLWSEVKAATGTASKDVTKQEKLQGSLRAVAREITAVEAALDSLDAAAEEQLGDNVDAEEANASTATGRSTECQEDVENAPDMKLQRAGLAQRLVDLQTTQHRLQDALEAATAPTPASESAEVQEGRGVGHEPGAVLQEDSTLEDQLNANEGNPLVETERDRLIRLGVLTPFDRLDGFERRVQSRSAPATQSVGRSAGEASTSGRSSDQTARDPFQRLASQLNDIEASKHRSMLVDPSQLPPRERKAAKVGELFWRQAASGKDVAPKRRRRQTLARERRRRPKLPGAYKRKRIRRAGETDGGSEQEEDEGGASTPLPSSSRRRLSQPGASGIDSEPSGSDSGNSEAEDVLGEWDDAEDEMYKARLEQWRAKRSALTAADIAPGQAPGASAPAAGGGTAAEADAADQEDLMADVAFDGGFSVPGNIYNRLFDYQKTGRLHSTIFGVKWLWELHTQRAGGIIGDEMGLGKTVQLAVFLAGLHHSRRFRPSIIVCPATVLRQWLRELRLWYPPFRVIVLHESQRAGIAPRPSRHELVKLVKNSETGILLTSYDQLRLQRSELLAVNWGYAILDEGHKIRNPDAEITLVAKQLATVHRIIMSGSPIQNQLTELWSLFDFVFPGKLGTLPVFRAQFALPIKIGGYANASAMQVSTAFKCAVVLRDLIAPYLLRRRKADVAQQLPKKTEQVLFCSLTTDQRDLYRSYLASEEVQDILNDRRNALAGIDILRKICNHPDLLQRRQWESTERYGDPVRSGKLVVALKVLQHWKQQGHKALFFTQTQQMLDIVERAVQSAGVRYHRMDGSTAVGARARLVDDFNSNDRVFVFLLTTKVGGLGINLTGADRVLLYDPDWNPSTDMQARERAWRIGQKREVTVYRLITSGTIEEKVYHRQIYKQFLTEKVLRDPKQKRFFKSKDIHDLFTLGDQYGGASETAQIFSSLHGGLEVPLDPDSVAVPVQTDATAGNKDGPSEAAPGDSSGEEAEADASGPSGSRSTARRRRRSDASSGAPRGSDPAEPATLAGALAASQEPPGEVDDAKILRDLFEGTGVMSALDHSKIEGANNPEALNIDAQAARIARRAAAALRQSRAALMTAPVNQPTWTGRSGGSGAPRFGATSNQRLARASSSEPGDSEGPAAGASAEPRRGAGAGLGRFGGGLAGTTGGLAPSSSVLLARLRERQAAVNAAASSAARNDPEVEEAHELSQRIVAYLEQAGGQSDSQALIQHFSADLPAAKAPLFRQLLQQVARLRRDPSAGKIWVLRPEFVTDR